MRTRLAQYASLLSMLIVATSVAFANDISSPIVSEATATSTAISDTITLGPRQGLTYTLSAGRDHNNGNNWYFWTITAADTPIGATLDVAFNVPDAGFYEIILYHVKAGDFGIHDISIKGNNGAADTVVFEELDSYPQPGDTTHDNPVVFSSVELTKGINTLTVKVKGKNSLNKTDRYYFGLNKLELRNKTPPVFSNATGDATDKTRWSELWSVDNQWFNNAKSTATVNNLGNTFILDETIVANWVAFNGSPTGTTFTQDVSHSFTGTLNLSGMTGDATFNGFTTAPEASPFTGATFSPGADRTLAINGKITGLGGMAFENGTTTIMLNSDDNAGGTYTVKNNATLKIGHLADVIAPNMGLFSANPDGRFSYAVETGGTLELMGTNLMGDGRYGVNNITGSINGSLIREEESDMTLTGAISLGDGARITNNATTGGLRFLDTRLTVKEGATVIFDGKQHRFFTIRTGGTRYATITLQSNSTVTFDSPIIIDGEDYRVLDVTSDTSNANTKVIVNSIQDNGTNTTTTLGLKYATLKVRGTTVGEGETAVVKTMENVQLHIMGDSVLDFTDISTPMLTVKKIYTGARHNVTVDITGRTFEEETQLIKWNEATENITIAIKGLAADHSFVERSDGIYVIKDSDFIGDAQNSATGLVDETLLWTPGWTEGRYNYNATLSNLGSTFAFDKNFSAKSVSFQGAVATYFTQAAETTVTVLEKWDFTAMTQPVTFEVPTVSANSFVMSNDHSFTFVGSTDPSNPQMITTTMKGTGGVIIKGSDDPLVKRYTKLDLRGNLNEGGHYTVKAGATLFLGTNDNSAYGSFSTNPNKILTYTVEAGATLDLYSTNPTGWGSAYTAMPYSGEVAGTVRSSNSYNNCISGTFTVRNGATFENTSTTIGERSGTGLLFNSTVLNVDDGATVTFTGTQFRCRRERDLSLRTFFNLGTGATMNVEAPTYLDGLGGDPRDVTVTGETGSQLILTSVEGAIDENGNKITDASLILDGPMLNATGDLSQIHLDLRQNTTILLKGRTDALSFSSITFPETGELTLDMAGWKGTSTPGIATPLLSWTGTKPEDLTLKTINADGVKIDVVVNVDGEGNPITVITATPYTVTITPESGTVFPGAEDYLRGIMKRNITISAEDANNAYAFTLVPTVNEETGKATLDCSFKLTKFVLHTNNTRADITIEVVSTGSTTAPTLALGSKIDIVASANVSTGYISVGDKFSATTITSVAGNKERSSAIIANIPIDPSTPFFKASILIQ